MEMGFSLSLKPPTESQQTKHTKLMATVGPLILKEEMKMRERLLGGLNSRHTNVKVWHRVPLRTSKFACFIYQTHEHDAFLAEWAKFFSSLSN